jgi:hypothetical protein
MRRGQLIGDLAAAGGYPSVVHAHFVPQGRAETLLPSIDLICRTDAQHRGTGACRDAEQRETRNAQKRRLHSRQRHLGQAVEFLKLMMGRVELN